MAMCSTGSIGILGAPQGGCSSLSLAICNTQTGPKSLCQLLQTAGLSIPQTLNNLRGYDNFIVDTANIGNIPAAGGVCNCPKLYGPAPITFTMSDSETWIVPDTPVTLSTSGAAQPVCICTNTGIARTGCVCFLPSTGGQKTTTYQQLAGATITCRCVSMNTNVCCCGNNTAICSIAYKCMTVTPNPNGLSETYCPLICWNLQTSSTDNRSGRIFIIKNGVVVYSCAVTTMGQFCNGSYQLSLSALASDTMAICLTAWIFAGGTEATAVQACIQTPVASSNNCYCRFPICIFSTNTCGAIP